MIEPHRHAGAGAGVTHRRARSEHKYAAGGQHPAIVRLAAGQARTVFSLVKEVVRRCRNPGVAEVSGEACADPTLTHPEAPEQVIARERKIEILMLDSATELAQRSAKERLMRSKEIHIERAGMRERRLLIWK